MRILRPLVAGALLCAAPFALAKPKAATPAEPAEAREEPRPPADVAKVKDQLKLLTDGKKHYVAVVPFGADVFDHVYYGDGKTFHAQRVIGGGSSGTESFDRVFWDPRHGAGYRRELSFRDKKYSVQCGDRVTELQPVPDAEAKSMVDAARFLQPRWTHRAYALARDDEGNYYYVDKQREPEESKVFRLYAGPKGSMKPLKMTNIVSDSQGDMFATRTGQLRLILNKGESTWVVGPKHTKLLLVPVEDNGPMIYTDLGVYTGQPLGTPCDDF